MKHARTIGLGIVLALIIFAIAFIEHMQPNEKGISNEAVNVAKDNAPFIKSMRYKEAKELAGISGYVNTNGKNITIGDLVGSKVILVDFWTYSCINCQRTLPYITAWYEKYKDQGLEIIGVHSPEFDFEKDPKNVQMAIDKFGITYPVVQDNDYSTWRAYENRYWPHKYLIDIDGYIVYDHIGEGGYEETEKKIQELLKERAIRLKEESKISTDVVYPRVELDSNGAAESPETYFGAMRNERLANGTSGTEGAQSFKEPATVRLNDLYLVGDWNIAREYAQSVGDTARVIFKYKAQDVYIVASAPAEEILTVTRDGASVGREGGGDFGVGGLYLENEERLYRVIENDDGEEHTLEITVPKGVRFYTFTFG